MINAGTEYFEYLKTISWKAKIYKRFYLYPKISEYLEGYTLDVGCGLGKFIEFRQNTVGTDINPNMVQFCLRNGQRAVEIVTGSIPFDDKEFDSGNLDNVIEHIVDPSQLLAEIKRVLKNQGRLIVGVPGYRGYLSDDDHKVYYNLQTLKDLAEAHGFAYVSHFYVPFKSTWLEKHVRQYALYCKFIQSQ